MPGDDRSSSIADLLDRFDDVWQSVHDAAPSVWDASQKLMDAMDQMSREV